MSRDYWLGMAVTLLLIATGYWLMTPWLAPPPHQVAAFVSDLTDYRDSPLEHGQSRACLLQLQNRGNRTLSLQAVEFNQRFVTVDDELALPAKIAPHVNLTIPVTIRADVSDWGQYEVEVTAQVSNGRIIEPIKTIIVCEIAAHLNPDPPVVQFSRVKRTAAISRKTVKLWVPATSEPIAECVAESNDPAVSVSLQPLQQVEAGRRFLWQLQVEIDASRAQPQHRSQIVVRSGDGRPPVIVPVVGWVEE